MRYLVIALFSSVALGDAQINQLEGFLHAPYDAADTGREFFIDVDGSAVIQNGGALSSIVTIEHQALCQELPAEIAALPKYGRVTISSNDTGETCTITDVNGTATEVNDWRSATRLDTDLTKQPGEPGYHYGVCKLWHQIWCRN